MVLFLFWTHTVLATTPNDVMSIRNDAMNTLHHFNPNTVITNFTETPNEANLKPNEKQGEQVLAHESLKRLSQDDTAAFVVKEEHQRAKITPNDKASEIKEGARIIEKAEEVIRPGCHKEPVPCEEKITEKTCEETRSYHPLSCTKKLSVQVIGFSQSNVSRVFLPKVSDIDLTQCRKGDFYCARTQLVKLHAECEYLKVKVILKNQLIRLTKLPTCQDPTLIVAEEGVPPLFKANIEVTEYRTSEHWETVHCDDITHSLCIQESSNACLEPNQTKQIDGVDITRRCWGEEHHYQCLGDVESSCNPLMENGCSNIRAECLSKLGDYCILTSKVFQCLERTCFPDKEVCPPEEIPCANGSCDRSNREESDDVGEGISRLGTVAGTANEVANNQVQSHSASIFKGHAQECEKYILNLRDCCTDDGLLEDFMHCPSEMQALQKAKSEHRAVYIGHYKPHMLSTTRYVYCVFPTKLSGIVQIQGRLNQLHIPFGEATNPNCRGITPEELEHINFKALDIHEIVKLWMN